MGHATHFLQRLDRIDDRQTELALSLYRDDDLLKSVLASIELPEHADRLAISLEDPALGPFVVVTRAGRFVTCLAHGMRTGLPLVTRERFEIAASRVQRMRDELDRLRQLRESGAESQVKRLFRSMQQDGARFCCEDATVLARVQPLIAPTLAPEVTRMLMVVVDFARALAPLRFDRLSKLEQESVLVCDRLSWTIAHAGAVSRLVGDAPTARQPR
jgi:hypothetical protein